MIAISLNFETTRDRASGIQPILGRYPFHLCGSLIPVLSVSIQQDLAALANLFDGVGAQS
jgi:hypothetical protein